MQECEGQLGLGTEGVGRLVWGKKWRQLGMGRTERDVAETGDLEMERNWQELTGPEWCMEKMYGKR